MSLKLALRANHNLQGFIVGPSGLYDLEGIACALFAVSNVSERWMYIPVHLRVQRILEKKNSSADSV